MTSPAGARRAVELLIEEADSTRVAGRYDVAVAVAGRAVAGAEYLDDAGLLIRALEAEANPLRMLGDYVAALARYTRVLGLAEDSAADAPFDERTSRALLQSYISWADAAFFTGRMDTRRLFGVLDGAERWLATTGRTAWRAGILHARSVLHWSLGELDESVATAREALEAHRSGAPGYTTSTYRANLGLLLRDSGRSEESEPLYRAILDDPDADCYDRKMGWDGLAWCAHDAARFDDALGYATRAVELAEGLGASALVVTLEVLVAVHRARPDLGAATEAAARAVEAARRIGGNRHPFYALRNASDVALDRGNREAARALLDELGPHAAALDAATGTTSHSEQHQARRGRLDG